MSHNHLSTNLHHKSWRTEQSLIQKDTKYRTVPKPHKIISNNTQSIQNYCLLIPEFFRIKSRTHCAREATHNLAVAMYQVHSLNPLCRTVYSRLQRLPHICMQRERSARQAHPPLHTSAYPTSSIRRQRSSYRVIPLPRLSHHQGSSCVGPGSPSSSDKSSQLTRPMRTRAIRAQGGSLHSVTSYRPISAK